MKNINQNDLIIFSGNIIFAISLLPSIFSSDKPNIATSAMQIFLTFLYIKAYHNMRFKFALIINAVIGLLWGILLIQKL